MKRNKLNNVALENVKLQDEFWNTYTELVNDVILPYIWELLNNHVNGAEKSYCIHNFRVACKEVEGEYQGVLFLDSDVAKWLEAVGFSLAGRPNPKLEAAADEAIDLIARAQCEDGYLNTYHTLTKTPRWSNLFEGHELYIAGHMIEAAVAYYEGTGKRKFLDVVCRFADYIGQVFGTEEGQIRGYPGHPEVELALVKLYRVTNKKEYLKLAYDFVTMRGEKPCYFLKEDCISNHNYVFPEFSDFDMDYTQAHLPIREQMKAEGHAVRAVYLYSAMADMAYEYQDEELLRQCDTLWNDIVEKKMYITGSIGSAAYGERFTTDYDLPNNTNYSESCATVGLAMFSNRMFQITKDGKYMDVVEQALYNTLLAGIAQDGKHYFYVNPLEVVPEIAEKNPAMSHVKTTRQLWFGTACCPPNITRTLASLGNYMYAVEENSIYVNLFIASQIKADLKIGKVLLKLEADYPKSGSIRIRVMPESAGGVFEIAVRKPWYSQDVVVKVNGNSVSCRQEKGYIYLQRAWEPDDLVEIELNVSFRYVYSNPKVRNNIGRVSLMKGPCVYCLEEVDNGPYLSSILIDTGSVPTQVKDSGVSEEVVCAKLKGKRIDYQNVGDALYGIQEPEYKEDTFKAIPYCCWNNRGKGEMLVWMMTE